MMMYDMHVHSKFSSDSELDMEQGIIRAIELGLNGIAFTDHLDIDYVDHESEFQYDFNEYFKRIEILKHKYSSQIDILSGVEIGLQPHVLDETIERVSGFDFDFVIGSTHLVKRRDPYYGTYFKPGVSKKEAYDEYLDELFCNLRLYTGVCDMRRAASVCAMGHLDYIVRYAVFEDSRFLYAEHADIVDEIFKYIIDRGIAFEINTSTYLRQPLDTQLLTRYRELGGELITLGSDAHFTDRIGKNFNKYAAAVKSCGFDRLYYFKGMKPVPYKI